jgi:hypothetical protein
MSHVENSWSWAHRRAWRAGALPLAMAIAAGIFAAPAVAANSTQLRTPVVIGKHYEQNGFASCTSSGACDLVFSSAPSGRSLTISHVACHINTSPVRPTEITLFEVTPANAFARGQAMVPIFVSSSGGSRTHYTLFHETGYPVTGSPKVRVFLPVGPDRVINIVCQIAGQLAP